MIFQRQAINEWAKEYEKTVISEYKREFEQDYIKYLGNLRLESIGLPKVYEGNEKNPASWVDVLADANAVKTDFFEAKSTAYAKASSLIDDL